jgi:hypothetical protein
MRMACCANLVCFEIRRGCAPEGGEKVHPSPLGECEIDRGPLIPGDAAAGSALMTTYRCRLSLVDSDQECQ